MCMVPEPNIPNRDIERRPIRHCRESVSGAEFRFRAFMFDASLRSNRILRELNSIVVFDIDNFQFDRALGNRNRGNFANLLT